MEQSSLDKEVILVCLNTGKVCILIWNLILANFSKYSSRPIANNGIIINLTVNVGNADYLNGREVFERHTSHLFMSSHCFKRDKYAYF